MGITLNFSVILTEIIFILVSSFIFLIDKFVKNKNYAFYITLVTLILASYLILFVPFGEFTYAYKADFYSSTLKLFLVCGTLLISLLSYNYLQYYIGLNSGEYYGFLLFSMVGAFLMLSGMDLVTIYLALELMSFPVYFLIALNYAYNRPSLEGALKYFLVGSLGSVFILLGLGIIYYFAGTFVLQEISQVLAQNLYLKELLIGFVFILVGFSIKLSLVPFHMWAPDAYESAPVPITSFIAGIVKFAVIATLVKIILLGFNPLKLEIGEVLIPIILASILIGNIMAIKQDNIIRMLAYSSIAHAGYAGLGIISADYVGYSFTVFYMLVYLIMTIGIFGVLVFLANFKKELLYIPNMAALSEKAPFVSLLILILMFSLAGIPPTAGFIAKFYVLMSLIKAKYVWVALIAILFAVIGAYPYLRVLKVVYMDKQKLEFNFKYDFTFLIPVCIAVLLVIIIGIYPKPWTDMIYKTMYFYISSLFYSF
ncbi:MAG: NADH:ubiquinone oxidoreductase subunit 2 [Thermodesulfobacterium sp.]|uniref:NADH-quinone oxidoreductase subunit N n=1 Tax=Candidatus Thermodesulfobacterium syntrophicum TaxID=3060442 RepID=A0AAE3P5C9_9BACT|nr:NADH:ubiquinone oxidoreductase subunit 2 [Candidatus Thermodesulfobacterium syntrophicum]